MILSLEEIKNITFGALYIEEEDGKINFYRMTEVMRKHFKQSREDFGIKTLSTAGVCFDFYTTATRFSFAYEAFRASSRRFFDFTVLVDGEITDSVGVKENASDEEHGEVVVNLSGDCHRVTVTFPQLYGARVWDVKTNGDIEYLPRKARVLAYGDSITQGYDARLSANSYDSRVARELDVEIINFGIGGSCVEHAAIESIACDAVIVAYGVNDWEFKTAEEFNSTMQQFFVELAAAQKGKPVVVFLPIWCTYADVKKPIGTLAEASRVIASYASKSGLAVVDGIDFVPHSPEYFSPDGSHPTDEGFIYYAKEVAPVIKEMLKR